MKSGVLDWGNIAMDWLTINGLSLLTALIVLVIGFMVSKIVANTAVKVMKRAKVDSTLTSFVGNFLRLGLKVVVIIAALQELGFQTTSLIAVLGAASLAVALSLQGHLSSLAAGVMILIFRPFSIGDFIEGGGVSGTVEVVSIMNTTFKTTDGKQVIVPNTKLLGGAITNYSVNPLRRIQIVVGVGYEDDLKLASGTIMAVFRSQRQVLDDPEPTVQVSELGGSSVDFTARGWVKRADYWNTRCEMLEKIKLALDEAGVSIPYPQQDIHLFQQKDDQAA